MSRLPRVPASLVCGFGAAAARPGLVAVLWASHLVLGLAVSIPMFRWLYDATAYRPGADALLERFSFGMLAELVQFDSTSVLGLLQAGVAGGLLVATVVAPFLVAGALASLRDGTLRAAELGAATATLYWPFLRVLVFGRVLAIAAAAAAAAAFGFALSPLADSVWEAGWLIALAIRGGAAVIVLAMFFAAVDYALVQLERDRSRAGFRAWLAGVRLVFRHPVLALGLWAGAAVVLALAVMVFLVCRQVTWSVRGNLPGTIGVAIAFALQQAFMAARTWVRVALLGAEQHASDRVRETLGEQMMKTHANNVVPDYDGSLPAAETRPAQEHQ